MQIFGVLHSEAEKKATRSVTTPPAWVSLVVRQRAFDFRGWGLGVVCELCEQLLAQTLCCQRSVNGEVLERQCEAV
jgi:hypothetical protein